MEHAEPVAALGLFQVMGGQDDGDAVLLAELGEVVDELPARRRIDSGARLIEDQKVRLMEQRLGQFDPPLQPARKRFDQVIGA